jgi:tetratricopeptide (TPR) repeat protein
MGVSQGTGETRKRFRSNANRAVGIGVCAVVLAAGLAACSTSKSPSVGSGVTLQKALADYDAGNITLAKAEFQELTTTTPTDYYPWYDLGVIAQDDQQVSTAVADYIKALDINPTFESALYNLGVVRFQQGNFPGAITELTKAVTSNPKDANAHWNLGLALVRIHTKTDDALAKTELNKALALDPALIKTLGIPSRPAKVPAPAAGGTGPKGSGASGAAKTTTSKAP